MTESARITCAGCAILCDDVTISANGEAGGPRLEPRCALGDRWLRERTGRRPGMPAATIDGAPTDVETALRRAADVLRTARRPLIHGFAAATVEDARAAVALADRLGALITTEAPAGAWPGAPALALRGACTATLGEIRDRSRVVVVWREDPSSTHPRLLERLGFGDDAPARERAQRTLVVVDDTETDTARRADHRLSWPRAGDLDALTGLHARSREATTATGDREDALDGLLARLRAVDHAAIIYGGALSAGTGGQRRVLALYELVRALSHHLHVVTLALPAAAGTLGADDALTWQTGYSGTVDLAGGSPELDTTARAAGSHDGIDVTLSVQDAPATHPGRAAIALHSLPAPEATVAIRTAAAGIAAPGTAHRLDGVPLTLQAPIPGDAPSAATLLRRLALEVRR